MMHVTRSVVLAQQAAEPVLEQLDPPRRAALVMALLALVLLGLFLVLVAMVGGHWVRRMARHRPGDSRRAARPDDARQNRQLRESLRAVLPDAASNDTLHADGSMKDTKADS